MTRVVQVGMGGFGRNWAKEMIPQVTEVDLVACADPVPAARAAAVKQGIIPADRCYATAEEAIAATDPDAVLVTASLVGHVPAVRAALDAGRHVLVEKPFAPTVAEGRALVEQADRAGLTLMVSQNYRFFPAPRAVQALVAEGSLGEPHAVGIDFRRFSGAGGRRGAHHLLDEPLLVDMSIHHFDLLRAVLGRDALAVSAHTNNPKWTLFDGPPEGSAMIEFPDDLTVSYRGSWVSHGPPTAWAGEWRMDFEHGEVWWTSRGDGLDGRAAQESDEVWVRRDGRRQQIELPTVSRTDRAGSLTEFVTAIRDGREPETSGRDNLPSIGLTYAAVAAAASGLRTEV
jgi:predicted dehydrogenase